MSDQTDVLQGTLDLLIMRTIALEPLHGWAIAQRIQQISDDLLRVQQGLALSRAPPARTPGLDHGRMGRVGEQPPRALLRADEGGPQAAPGRSREVAGACRRVNCLATDVAVRAWHIVRSQLRPHVFTP